MGEYRITIDFEANKENAKALNELVGQALDDIYSELFDMDSDASYNLCDTIMGADQRLVKRMK